MHGKIKFYKTAKIDWASKIFKKELNEHKKF
jgi:hypothetical protein